ncbi:MAG TPA: recombinase family protein, partial [Dehalococcoidia bacterium]|nr:recombinase family protein [Dehalococcoidia bacterium]
DFNSLHAQRESAEAYIKSQAHEGWKLVRARYDDGGLSGGTMERPALQRLLADIATSLIDVVVVYKVDRLTRSLTDFAKLVETFEAHGVSFVSVTQQFNTTTSMGRLTLNVLLSFAQFEREVAGERIRDTFAASRRKGMWMGGNVPLGYDVAGRRLVVNEAEAKTVKLIFERYLELGCVRALGTELDRLGIVSKRRVAETGRMIGGGAFSRGALYYLLRNRVYRGEAVHKGVAHPGEHEAIIDEDLWEAVQAKLSGQATKQGRGRAESGALLIGLLFDDRGNRMSPSHTTRKGGRYRYYVSQAVLQGRKKEAGSIARIGADELEGTVVEAIRRAFPDEDRGANGTAVPDVASIEQVPSRYPGGPYDQSARDLVRAHVERIVVHATEVEISLQTRDIASPSLGADGEQVLSVPLERRPRDRKEIIVPGDVGTPPRRLDRSLVLAVARGRAWASALRRGEYADTAEIAGKCDLSEAYVRRILRLAFLAPDIVEAIAEGRQPRGLTLQRLLGPVPFAWAEQRRRFGFSV